MKWLRDNDPDFADAMVVLTGSSAESLTVGAGILAGRRGTAARTDRTLLPMGFRTFAATGHPAVADLPCIRVDQLHSEEGAAAYTSAHVWLDDLVRLWEHLRSTGRDELDPTVLAEAQVGMALRRSQLRAGGSWAAEEPLYYVRTATRKEIDFVGPALAGAAVEGKYIAGTRRVLGHPRLHPRCRPRRLTGLRTHDPTVSWVRLLLSRVSSR